MRERFLRAARGERTDRPPVWMMRQAGRYLPEYRELRADYSFRSAISTPEVATEISLQPWHRFHPDGIVLYSDILTVLEPLGLSYRIESGVGPVIDEPPMGPDDFCHRPNAVAEELAYVGDILDRLRVEVADAAALIGFVGGPFTVAAYAVEGQPSRSFMSVRRLLHTDPTAFAEMLSVIADALVELAILQVEHGADVIQLFDTHAGLLSREDYATFILPVQRRILAAIDVPTIIFARNMSGRLDQLAATGANVIGLDWTVEMASARAELGDRSVQGNLDPAVLFADPATVAERTRAIIDAAGNTGHILNLGHGVDKNTPVAGVEAFFNAVKDIDRGH